MYKKKFDRRTALRGGKNIALSLPILDIMLNDNGTAFADNSAIPKKYLYVFHGISIGNVNNPIDGNYEFFVPKQLGKGYDIRPSLGSLANYAGLQEYVSVVSNLLVPKSGIASNQYDDGGTYHKGSMPPAVLGVSNEEHNRSGVMSSDQIFMDALYPGHESGAIAMAAGLQTGSFHKACISVRNGRDAKSQNLPNLWNSIFEGKSIPAANLAGTGIEGLSGEFGERLYARKLMLDFIKDDRDKVMRLVGREDKAKLEAYFEKIAALEKKVQAQIASQVSGTPSTGSTGGEIDLSQCRIPQKPDNLPSVENTPVETARYEIISDLIAVGMSCDFIHGAAIMASSAQESDMGYSLATEHDKYNFFPGKPKPDARPNGQGAVNFHVTTHSSGDQVSLSMVMNWGLIPYFNIAEHLRQTPVGDGNLLDNSALIFQPESGIKYRTVAEEGNNNDNVVHSGRNKAMLIAGGAGNLKRGEHIDGDRQHPASVVLTVLNELGVPADSFNDVSQKFNGLTT